ncbi:hypothetical protein B0H10DRAFT_983683 [Mycena sp. CBHHK59/15]|nr:hypothetical protein B0H10DRAFT_983683 [Mycena sp. CBHHK59/15]
MLLLTLLVLPLLSAALLHRHHGSHDHAHVESKRLPSAWYHRADHPVHELFKRGDATDGVEYASIGSPTWSSPYPSAAPDVNALPAAWVNALKAAVSRGAIPDTPVSTNLPNETPTYPAGHDPNGPEVCSASYQCRIPGDIWDAPDGHLGISFDDGPQPASDALLSFLKSNNQAVTHFMIGSNIIDYPNEFQTAFNQGNDIAVHTWTHPYMTTQSNLQVVGELGWTMQLIHNSTGGRVPKFWRPPYGDSDTRVSAIAKEVFGLTTIIWNQDTSDWSLTTGGTTQQAIKSSMQQWLTGPKSPGLIILEHELSDLSVGSFIAAYPVMKANNWTTVSLAQLVGDSTAYRNADGAGPVTNDDILAGNVSVVPASSSVAAASAGVPGSSTKQVAAKATGSVSAARASASASASTSSTPNAKNSASANWRMGPTALIGAVVSLTFMLWA